MNTLQVRQHTLPLPAFLPDATFGYVRSLTSTDLSEAGVQAVMMNAFHLMQKPGSSVIQAMGGLHLFWLGWLIMTIPEVFKRILSSSKPKIWQPERKWDYFST